MYFPQKRLIKAFILLIVATSFSLWSQQTSTKPWDSRMNPVAPQIPEKSTDTSLDIQEDTLPASTYSNDDAQITEALQGILIIGDPNDLRHEGVTGVRGLKSDSIEPPALDALKASLQAYWGQPLTLKQGVDIARIIGKHYREHDNPLVYVVLPPMQKIVDNTLQILIIEGRIGDILVEGASHTNPEQLRRQMHQSEDTPIRLSVLEQDMEWLNTSTRKVDMIVGKGKKKRTADVTLNVIENKPWTLSAGYSNNGSKLTNESRYNIGISHANLWKRDHLLAYQYTQGSDVSDFFSHFISYNAPLHRWRHNLKTFFSYSESTTEFAAAGLTSRTEGKNTQFGIRYSVPLQIKRMTNENVSFGIDYKHSDSGFDFAFFGTPLTATPIETETVQFVAGYDLVQKYGRQDSQFPGSFSYSANLFFSPGGITGKNDDAAYRRSNVNADAQYAYGQMQASRVIVLFEKYLLNFKGSAQYSSETLLGAEQFTITGDGYVRGYDPSEATGDHGYLGTVELYAPGTSLFEKIKTTKFSGDYFQPLAFMDYGYVGVKEPNGRDPNIEAWSLGTGLRWSYNKTAYLKFDYAWQLKDTGANSIYFNRENSRAHLSANISW